MDLLHDSLQPYPSLRRKRLHFADFMLDVHRRLHHLRGSPDPLATVAAEFTRGGAGRTVLCLDEFAVTDVADAALLSRLFSHLFASGLVLIATSNRQPERLYAGGLQRHLFLPFIALLCERCEVHDIAGAQDYRLLATRLAQPLWFRTRDSRGGSGGAGGAGSEAGPDGIGCEQLAGVVAAFAPGVRPAPLALPVPGLGRALRVPRAAGPTATFTFAELLEAPLSSADYIALCSKFHTLLLDGLPVLCAATRPAAYRLVALVDAAYDAKARLVVASEAASPAAVFGLVASAEGAPALAAALGPHAAEALMVVDDNLAFVAGRTVSRLVEMQSADYARAHAAARAPELVPSLPALPPAGGGGAAAPFSGDGGGGGGGGGAPTPVV